MKLCLFVMVVFALAACGDDASDGAIDSQPPGARGDASVEGDATSDASPAHDAGAEDPLFASPEGPNADAARCVESREDDRGAPLGCEDDGCRTASHACCVGQAECCTAAVDLVDLRFESCESGCVEGALFGSPLPTFTDGFSPGGDGEFDSGVVLDGSIDLRGESVRVEAGFVVPEGACSGSNCFQTLGVSIARNAPVGAFAHVRTIAGLLWSGGRMYLVVGERSIRDWPAETGGEWTLSVDADGDLRVQSAANSVNDFFNVAILPSEAHIVLHGHNVNPGGGEGTAHLSSLRVSRSECEMTRQWGERSAIEVGSGRTERLVGVSSPTSVRDRDGRLRIAYLRDGRLITTLRGSDATPNVWVAADETRDALMADGVAIAGPELALEGDKLSLFYEIGGQIFRAEEATDNQFLRFEPGEVVSSVSVSDATVHAPTFASRGGAAEGALVVRVEYAGSRPTLASFSVDITDGVVVARLRDFLPTEALGDELGDPELFIRNRLYQLYVPYRRGTRWRLAHMTSEDFVFWTIADEVALESGGADELFGPQAPDAVVSEAGVEVFYERFDGVQQSLGRIFRKTPENATLRSGI